MHDEHDTHRTTERDVFGRLTTAEAAERLGDPDLADAIMDRLVHNAHRIEMKGESQRKIRSELTMLDT